MLTIETCFEEAIILNDEENKTLSYLIKNIKKNGQKNTVINIFILVNIVSLNLMLLNILS